MKLLQKTFPVNSSNPFNKPVLRLKENLFVAKHRQQFESYIFTTQKY